MDSSTMLMQASSGLEKLMAGSKPGVLKDSTVAQISAYLYYNASVISKITSNKQFQSKFTKVIFDQINKDFGEYIDALARSKPKSLHHVYEWNRAGQKNARLFKLSILSKDGLSFTIKDDFLPSRSFVPASNKLRRRHVFIDKARVIEEGKPLVISPKHSERLVFESEGSTIFMPKGASVRVNRPGGSAATNQYYLAHSRFFKGQMVNNSIKKSGFQKLFNSAMAKSLKLPTNIKRVQYKFSPNIIRSQADASLTAAFGAAL